MPTSQEEREKVLDRIWQIERFTKKESKNVHVSHEAWNLFHLMAADARLELGPFFETIATELARQRLSEEQRDEARRQAQQTQEDRERQAQELRQSIDLGPEARIESPTQRRKRATASNS